MHEWNHQSLHKCLHLLLRQTTNQIRAATVEERCQAYQSVWRQPRVRINKDQDGV